MSELILPRRKFLQGLGVSIIAAPAVVRAASLMKITAFDFPINIQDVPLDMYAELSRITRMAFVPIIYAQIYEPSMFLKQLGQGARA